MCVPERDAGMFQFHFTELRKLRRGRRQRRSSTVLLALISYACRRVSASDQSTSTHVHADLVMSRILPACLYRCRWRIGVVVQFQKPAAWLLADADLF